MSDHGAPSNNKQYKTYKRIPGKAPLIREDPPDAKGPKQEEDQPEDEPMYETNEVLTEARLSELFVTDDKLAYGKSRKAVVQQRLNHATANTSDEVQIPVEAPKKQQQQLSSFIILTNNANAHHAMKREREAAQTTKREDTLETIRKLKAARRKQEMCKNFMEGKCDKKRHDCPRGEHGSIAISKNIMCASAKEGSGWKCRWSESDCPYYGHVHRE